MSNNMYIVSLNYSFLHFFKLDNGRAGAGCVCRSGMGAPFILSISLW